MGMSDDFEVAIEEGATIVRVGRAIFGERHGAHTHGPGDAPRARPGPLTGRLAPWLVDSVLVASPNNSSSAF